MFWITLKYKYENVLKQLAKPACMVPYHMGNFIVIFIQMHFSVIACKLFGVTFVGAYEFTSNVASNVDNL